MNIKVGQEVWFERTWLPVSHGIVKEIVMAKDSDFVKVSLTNEGGVETCVRMEDLYPTKEALVAALEAKRDAQVKGYCDSIKTVEDLVRFCFEHNMYAEEYTDYEAREAAISRAKDLLGITLE